MPNFVRRRMIIQIVFILSLSDFNIPVGKEIMVPAGLRFLVCVRSEHGRTRGQTHDIKGGMTAAFLFHWNNFQGASDKGWISFSYPFVPMLERIVIGFRKGDGRIIGIR